GCLNRQPTGKSEQRMATDPWAAPTMEDLRRVLETFQKQPAPETRESERLELQVQAEIRTSRGNVVKAITREISRGGIGLLHRGEIKLEEVTVRLTSDTREFVYRLRVEWCRPCDNGMFLSGGRFLGMVDEDT
ncbi:MAG: PilZ domain-containing protein, partial [Planctomycetaceae bacterium]